MRIDLFRSLASVMFLLACVAAFTAKHFHDVAVQKYTRASTGALAVDGAAVPVPPLAHREDESRVAQGQASRWSAGGLGLAVLGLLALGVATWRQERMSLIPALSLFGLYLLLQFLA